MSRTLFKYIFRDLLKIFFLTSGVLAGIMSFGGLLRPLTEHGLDAGQAVRMLSYFMPAMSTYSLPVAALFATTMVYGRLAADNELTACRAAGISFISMGMPALMLGLIVAIFSLLLLCFIVPVFTLKVERVIYSNLAQLIANQIDRTHQFKFGEDTTVYAQDAAVSPVDPAHPREQVVTLAGLMIVSYEKPDVPLPGMDPKMRLPHDFYFARQATAIIRPGHVGGDDEFTLEATLDDGTMFPRTFAKASQGGLASTKYGPIPLESPIRENTKFWDIRRLKAVYRDRGQSREVHKYLTRLVRADQSSTFLNEVAATLNSGKNYLFDAGTETFELSKTTGDARLHHGRLELPAGGTLTQWRDGRIDLQAKAADVEMSVDPISDNRFSVQVELHNSSIQTGDEASLRHNFTRPFTMNMPSNIAALDERDAAYYETAQNVPKDQQSLLRRELIKLGNGILSEIHSRVSFAVSCLLLVIIGYALGTMFRSGNFLSAFAVSVIPALICIALIVAGQHTCENIPYKLENFKNPLKFGLALIWSGNAMIATIAGVLVWRLQRQ